MEPVSVRQIVINTGEDGSVFIGKILEKDQYSYGFDAQNGEYVNLVTKGIIDPTKIVPAALQNAASISGLLIRGQNCGCAGEVSRQDRVSTEAIEGAADQIWSQTVVDPQADVAAVNAIASGSQHSTIRAMSHRIARSESVSTPTNSAIYRIGAASVSILRPWAATDARSALRAANVLASRFRSSTAAGLLLPFHCRHGNLRLAAPCRLLNG